MYHKCVTNLPSSDANNAYRIQFREILRCIYVIRYAIGEMIEHINASAWQMLLIINLFNIEMEELI